jgi:hypothetical protein
MESTPTKPHIRKSFGGIGDYICSYKGSFVAGFGLEPETAYRDWLVMQQYETKRVNGN